MPMHDIPARNLCVLDRSIPRDLAAVILMCTSLLLRHVNVHNCGLCQPFTHAPCPVLLFGLICVPPSSLQEAVPLGGGMVWL
jgi:hypothetical protein